MVKTFDQGKEDVAKLCQYFAANRQSFLAPGVKEAHIRQSLIDPFFAALGWDVRNASMAAPQYREVIPEDSLDVEGQLKAPDYTFRVGTLPKFYVEAKKYGVNISADPAPAYQLRRYGFSAKLALSILTDFEELGVYDCAARPRPGDKASHACIQYFGFTEYPDRWREIWDVFSREAVWSGTFDQYAASKRKRGTSEVDSEFLKDIEGWRDVLARNLALRNSDLSADDLNAAVQRIIDRLIFLRMAEDRGLESYGQLLKLCEQPDIYNRFMSGLCRKADQKYNSGLFHFQKETGVADAPDTLTPRLAVDDNALKPILQSLYFEHGCPYHFGVLPVEILGTVYERFLGKVIRLTAGHQAKVEEKPEVRKAGGVYYTPAYIVNYIVQNTIGKQIEGKSPADLAGGKTTPPFRVLDMACGSGSFLLGAYQFLLDHCLKWHLANPSTKPVRAVCQNAKGETCLTIAERKRILTTHIYGVDIDRQAVETTKLSLLLKALEGENDTTLSQQMTLFHERALPNLSANIKCGNSLIASDFSMVPEDLVRVSAFDWSAQFPDAMKAGGFDAIIGNPPYVRMEEFKPFKDYFRAHYQSHDERADLYVYFIERSINLLRMSGLYGVIVSNKWMRSKYGGRLRSIVTAKSSLEHVVDFGELPVFQDAATFPVVLITRRGLPEEADVFSFTDAFDKTTFRRLESGAVSLSYIELAKCISLSVTKFSGTDWHFGPPEYEALRNKMRAVGQTLSDYTGGKIRYGIKTGLVEAFVISEETRNRLVKQSPAASLIIKPYVVGDDVRKYHIRSEKRYLIYTHHGINMKGCASVLHHLESFRPRLVKRATRQEWYELQQPQFAYAPDYESPKILYPDITKESRFALDTAGIYPADTTFSIPLADLYLLGILNSRAVFYFLKSVCPVLEDARVGGRLRLKLNYIQTLPIPGADRAHHDKLVELVKKMQTLTPKLRGATSESEKAALQNAVTTTDAEIDRLVYELYGLTEEEIKIVEAASV